MCIIIIWFFLILGSVGPVILLINLVSPNTLISSSKYLQLNNERKYQKPHFFPSRVFILKNHTGNALDDKNAENMIHVLQCPCRKDLDLVQTIFEKFWAFGVAGPISMWYVSEIS